jgi:glycosyltransferase involved in cell wall biosynthesis
MLGMSRLQLETGPVTANFYEIARTAHFERTSGRTKPWILFSRKNYDFDGTVAENYRFARQLSVFRLGAFVRRNNISVLEVNEPLMLPAWRSLLVIFFLRASGLAFRRPLKIVFYAIENLDPARNLAKKTRLPIRISRLIVRGFLKFALAQCDRVCFGTKPSAALYDDIVGRSISKAKSPSLEVTQVSPLPVARSRNSEEKQPGTFLFLGEFSTRKGVERLIEVWPEFAEGRSVSLTLIGQGPLVSMVQHWALRRAEVTVFVDPPRSLILDELDRAESLVLLSRQTTSWKEQIGLPLLEGWASGCRLLATDSTGIATELSDAGHQVIPEDFSNAELLVGLEKTLADQRSASEIASYLPLTDGRITASNWLHASDFVPVKKGHI